ncbi:glycosyltransferase, partial [Candidatus Woesearchaeota archaeon]|nr:glycosyltransferase [Candidatus Woesearchaeota archaeon]
MIFIKILIGGSYLVTLYILIYWFLFYFEKKDFIHKDNKKIKKLKQYPLVSIIMPCFNEEKNINKSLTSIQNLQYPKDKIELIIINDGSTDKSEIIIKKYIKNNPKLNIKYISQKNYGKGRALNNGLKILKGTLFAC